MEVLIQIRLNGIDINNIFIILNNKCPCAVDRLLDALERWSMRVQILIKRLVSRS
jgi:hypothetical protein